MNRSKLIKLKRKLGDFRSRGGIKSRELESFAKRLGRFRDDRGKEPTWVNEQFPTLRPLSIPHHSTDLNKNTARAMLDQLQEDIEKWEEELY